MAVQSYTNNTNKTVSNCRIIYSDSDGSYSNNNNSNNNYSNHRIDQCLAAELITNDADSNNINNNNE